MIDRLGRPTEIIEQPHLSAILTIQPSVLDEIMNNKKMSGRGLMARFLYSSPPSNVGHRTFCAPVISEEVRNDYHKLINSLLDISVESEPKTLQLSAEATELMQDYFNTHEEYLRGEGQAIIEWASKYIGAILRIADFQPTYKFDKFSYSNISCRKWSKWRKCRIKEILFSD